MTPSRFRFPRTTLAAIWLTTAIAAAPARAQVISGPGAAATAADSLDERLRSQELELARLRAAIDRLEASERTDSAGDPAQVAPAAPPFEVHGLVQAWYTAGEHRQNAFSVRRAEVALLGAISPRVSWTVMVDPSKALALRNSFADVDETPVLVGTRVDQGSNVLQDAFFTVGVTDNLSVRFGQFLVPLSMEGLAPAGGLETVERTLFTWDRARGGTFGDVRDIGVAALGTLAGRVEYSVGLFNGLGTGIGSDGGRGVAGRLVVEPWAGIRVGGSAGYAGAPLRERYGVEARVDRGPVTLMSEVMTGADAEVSRLGFYGLAAYQVRPSLRLVARYDSWDPDTALESAPSDARERNVTAGFGYRLLDDALTVQVNYVRRWFDGGLGPSENLLRMNLQTAW